MNPLRKPISSKHIIIATEIIIPSTFTRMISPLARTTRNFNIVDREFPALEQAFEAADLIFGARTLWDEVYEEILCASERGVPVIYEIDDNLLELPPDSGVKLSETLRSQLQTVMEIAQCLIVSTPTLAEALARYNRRIFVVPNAGERKTQVALTGQPHLVVVNTDYFKIDATERTQFFESVRIAIETLNYSATFIGTETTEMVGLKSRFPDRVRTIALWIPDRSKFLDYLSKMKPTVAAAPLSDTWYHSFKSDIKYLDYGSLGIPGIYNNNTVYNSVKHKINGFLCGASGSSWLDGLTYFADFDNRKRCGDNAYFDVNTHRSFENQSENISNILRSAL
jgi:hypothetical protein